MEESKKEHTYPIYKKSVDSGLIVMFESENTGVVVRGAECFKKGEFRTDWSSHVDDSQWDVFVRQEKEPILKTTNKRSQILDTAKEMVNGYKNGDGNTQSNFSTIAKMWGEYLDHEISAQDVAAMMILLKVARIKNKSCEDSWVDIAGYAALGAEIE